MAKGLPRSMSRGAPLAQEIIKQTVVVRNATLTVTGGSSTNPGTGTIVIGELPKGNILFLGAVASFQFAGSGSDSNLTATWDGDYSIGTAANANTSLTGTDVDIIPSTALGAATAEVSPVAKGTNATQSMLVNTDDSMEINLNLLTDDNVVTDAATVDLTVNGTLILAYIILGNA